MKNKKILGVVCVGVLTVASVWGWLGSDTKLRRDLKALCQKEDCRCFYNVVDYRFTPEEARIYWRITQEAKVRPQASSLEFADPTTYRNIMSALAVCQGRPVVQRPQPVLEKPVEKPAEKSAVKAQEKAVPAAPKSKPIKK